MQVSEEDMGNDEAAPVFMIYTADEAEPEEPRPTSTTDEEKTQVDEMERDDKPPKTIRIDSERNWWSKTALVVRSARCIPLYVISSFLHAFTGGHRKGQCGLWQYTGQSAAHTIAPTGPGFAEARRWPHKVLDDTLHCAKITTVVQQHDQVCVRA